MKDWLRIATLATATVVATSTPGSAYLLGTADIALVTSGLNSSFQSTWDDVDVDVFGDGSLVLNLHEMLGKGIGTGTIDEFLPNYSYGGYGTFDPDPIEGGPETFFGTYDSFTQCNTPACDDIIEVLSDVTTVDGTLCFSIDCDNAFRYTGFLQYQGPNTYTGELVLHMDVPQPVASGTDVPVETEVVYRDPETGAVSAVPVSLTFGSVTDPGTVVAEFVGATELEGIADIVLEAGSWKGPLLDITTTSTFEGSAGVEICLGYDDVDDDGFVDGSSPPVDETDLKLLHEESGAFVDVTDSVDTSANLVCGTVDHFSLFALALEVENPCPALPATGCLSAGKGSFQIKRSIDDPGKDQVSWKWQAGAAFDQAVLGDPVTATDYALCIYDHVSTTPTAATVLEIPYGAGWSDSAPKGVSFKSKTGSPDGVQQVKIKTGIDGKTQVQVKAKGENIPMPTPAGERLFAQTPKVTVQFHRMGSETCWGSDYFVEGTKSNDANTGFQAAQ